MKELPMSLNPAFRLAGAESWFDDASVLDMDYFVKTVSAVKAKGVRPDLIGSIIAYHASKWLPDLSPDENIDTHKQIRSGSTKIQSSSLINNNEESNSISSNSLFSPVSPESVTVTWKKKRFFIETLVGILPPEKDSVPCNFLLRLLRAANMVSVESSFIAELERRVSWQLDQASLKELLIPNFSHTSNTLFDIELVSRLVERFVSLESEINRSTSGAAMIKVAKLVDCYLAEAAVDSNLSFSDFMSLAASIPPTARASDDGLYRAIDTYLKAHPGVSKQERKTLCRLIDSRKLSPEAAYHAAQNERLPVRVVIQVLYSEQAKLNRNYDWSGSFSGTRSPNAGLDPPARCLSKREVNKQQMEIWKLKEDVNRLQSQCNALQVQIEKLMERKKGLFGWMKLGFISSSMKSVSVMEKIEECDYNHHQNATGMQTLVDVKSKLVKKRAPPKWRKSMS